MAQDELMEEVGTKVMEEVGMTVETVQIEFSEKRVLLEKVENLRGLLDDIEDQVQKLRTEAVSLIEDKEDIQTTLEMISAPDQLDGLSDVDREEIEATVDRLAQRVNAVNINVTTARSPTQQESLHHVNRAIDTLIFQIQTDTMQANIMCSSYLSAAGMEIERSPSDPRFEQHLLGCTVEDQKNVKKRLMGLLDHIKVLVCDSIKETDTDSG